MTSTGPRAPGAVPELRLAVAGPVAAGVAIVILFFVVLGGWAAIAPLQSAAIAPGVVNVDTNRKTVQHLEGGIVSEILVRDGDGVTAGQILVRLGGTQARTTLDLLRSRYLVASALEVRLVSERDGLDAIGFPD